MDAGWHHDFNPQVFLSSVDLERFLRRNEAYAESRVDQLVKPCFLCGGSGAPGLLLNEGSCLCGQCFEQISHVQYPEKYEAPRRQHIAEREAHALARRALIRGSVARRMAIVAGSAGICSLGLLLISFAYVAVPGALALVVARLRTAHERRVREWDSSFPPPVEPTLRHFHDPAAELTERDAAILHVFDHWPGNPPYWAYLREVVLKRDGRRCQVSGCPSRLQLHIHHIVPRADGGAHAPSNLVTLCDFHHALEPEKGHERVWGDIKNRFFTLVCEHERSNRASQGTHLVRAHLRRLRLATLQELHEIAAFYGFLCPMCGSSDIEIAVNSGRNLIEASCTSCAKSIEGPQQLAEESGPRLAEALKVGRNEGRWKARWDALSDRKASKWGEWKAARIAPRPGPVASKTAAAGDRPACPLCGSRMYLVRPRLQDQWKAFWGCTQYRTSGCRGKRQYSGK